ncbi:MAG: branched-chain amino acid ABC transporter permease [Deltaproteobacteria bacterium]|nr:branched-chain amino acid ABC transporter permease [Deltaproteobacteria bacterium]
MNKTTIVVSSHLRMILSIAILLLLLLLPQVITSPYHLDILILIFLWGALAEAYNISGGYAGQFSLGHSAFLALGAYSSTILFLKLGISPWLGALVGAALAAAVSLLLGSVTFRLRGPFLGLATMAFAEVTQIVAINWRSLTLGSEGIGIPFKPGMMNMIFADKVGYYYLGLLFCAGTVLITWLISRSRLGYYLIATRENQDAARALGVNTTGVKSVSLLISAALTAVGGTFYAQYILYIDPNSLASFDVAIQFPLIAVVGGIGTVFGPIVGAAIMIPLSQILRSTISGTVAGLDLALYGLILMLVVLFTPQGLVVEAQLLLRKGRAAITRRRRRTSQCGGSITPLQ